MANTEGESDDNGIIISKRETTTSPGGFSSVAEPAGPVDPEAAKRAAEEYAQKCILPRVEVVMTMGIAPGPPRMHRPGQRDGNYYLGLKSVQLVYR